MLHTKKTKFHHGSFGKNKTRYHYRISIKRRYGSSNKRPTIEITQRYIYGRRFFDRCSSKVARGQRPRESRSYSHPTSLYPIPSHFTPSHPLRMPRVAAHVPTLLFPASNALQLIIILITIKNVKNFVLLFYQYL